MKLVLILVLSLLSFGGGALGNNTLVTHMGIAKNQAGKVVYREWHEVQVVAGEVKSSLTTYYAPTSKEKIAELRSNYSKSIKMPTYEFVDLRTNYREGLRFENNKYIIYNQEAGELEGREVLSAKEALFSCQGWHYYLINNLSTLEKSDIALNLILPSELDFFRFRVQQVESSKDLVVADLKLSNWILSLFAPSLQLTYDKKLKKLVRYEGISNILTKNGETQDVVIDYDYTGTLKP